MPVTRSPARRTWVKPWGLTLLFTALCWAGNYTSLPLLFGVDFIFGSIASFLALALVGSRAAIFVALIGSCYTWLLWSHPYAIVIFTAEVVCVGAFYRLRPSINLVYADLAYWLCLGIPLVIFFYTLFLGIDLEQALFIGIKQTMNAVSNLLCANLIILLLRTYWPGSLAGREFLPLSIKNLMFNLILAITLIAGATPIILSSTRLAQVLEADVAQTLEAHANHLLPKLAPDIEEATLRDQLHTLPLRQGSFIALKNRDGTVMQHGPVPPLDQFELRKTLGQHLTLWIDKRQSSALQRWNNGIYLYRQQIDRWTLTVGRPAAPLVNKLQQEKRNDFILLNILLFLAIAIAQLISRTVAKPLSDLQGLSQAIGSASAQQTLDNYRTSPVTEYQSLLNAFTQMSQRLDTTLRELRESKDTLEQRVEARTRDIQRLSLVASTTNNGVAILNNEQCIVWSNPALHNLLVQTTQHIWGRPLTSLLRCRDPLQSQALQDAIAQESNFHLQLSVTNDTHKHLWIELEWIRTTEEEHGHQGHIVIIADITTEKRVKEELTVYAARLENNNLDLDKARKAALEAARIKSEFLASMSHEIRTPLNGVVGMLGLLSRTEQNEQQTHYTNLALHSAESLLNIINEILDFSKIEAGQLSLEKIDFDLLKLVSEFAETHALRAQDKGVELYLDATNVDLTHLNSDPSRLLQILNNLTSNAIKFTEQGRVHLSASSWQDDQGKAWLKLSVADTGIGIEPAALPHLFDAFTQADASTTRKYGGTGLGLAITKQLCRLLEGELTVTSQPGEGSTFTATLPVLNVAAPQENHAWPQLKPSTLYVMDRNKFRRELTLKYFAKCQANAQWIDDYSQLVQAKPEWILTSAEMLPELQAFIADHNSLQSCRRLVLCSHTERTKLMQKGHWINCAQLPSPMTPTNLHLLAQLQLGRERSTGLAPVSKTQTIGRLLLVEDNHINQELARSLLMDMGYHVGIAGNGAEALDQLIDTPKQDAYQLILMDCQMPEMDGYTATKLIRAGKAGKYNRDLPIIAMTANALTGDKEKCLAVGMNDYLTKPLDFDLVEKVLGQWINGEGPETNVTNQDTKPDKPTIETGEGTTDVWDFNDALKRVRQREDRLRTLVELFLRDMPGRCEKIDKYVSANDIDHVGRLAHEIKGVAGNISARSLYECAKELEKCCKDNQLNEQLHKKLHEEMEAVTQRLGQYLKHSHQPQ